MHVVVWTLVWGSPFSNKLRFLTQNNISKMLMVDVKGTWGTNHQRLEHLIEAMQHVPQPLLDSGFGVEFGTRQGEVLRWLAGWQPAPGNLFVRWQRSPLGNLSWHGFDSFEGLPPEIDGGGGIREARWTAGKYTTNGRLPNMTCCPNIRLHKGWFNVSTGHFLDAHPRKPVAFAHMDADLYSSSRTVLNAIFSRCAHRIGTVFSFDELFGTQSQEQHEFRALRETSELWGVKWRFISYAMTNGSPFARAAIQIEEPDAPHCVTGRLKSEAQRRPVSSGELTLPA